ncbi:hypothetical protein PMZ80_010133 [Knufia obscura]|uniref:DUF6604 domain-containing protein n=1 Tax=Knufia obscura TaxID=1635080 RepID=A0ABR0RA63_9EURO|nr:hypothetical protein PMZ80_010133 [Knufia obscura]
MSTKLAPYMIDTYAQYKPGEEELIEYFVDTTRRSKAREAVLQGSESPAQSLPRRPAIHQILPLIECVANDASIRHIPRDIAWKLRDVIRKRASCAAWYRKRIGLEDEEGQQRLQNHAYPLKVLRDAVDILQDKLPPLQSTTDKSGSPMAANAFDALHFEDPQLLDDINSLSLDGAKSPYQSPTKNDATPTPRSFPDFCPTAWRTLRDSDALMMKYCLIQEMKAMEAIVIQQWLSYIAGSCSLVEAALVTNHAVDAIRQREQSRFMAFGNGSTDSADTAYMQASRLFEDTCRTKAGNASDPLLRMQEVISKLINGDLNCEEPDARWKAIVHNTDYFTASVDEQASWELKAIQELWCSMLPRVKQHQGLLSDVATVHLLRWVIDRAESLNTAGSIPMCLAFGMRMELLISHICCDHAEAAVSEVRQSGNDMEKITTDFLKRQQSQVVLLDNYSADARQRSISACDAIFLGVKAGWFPKLPADQSQYLMSYLGLKDFALRYFYTAQHACATLEGTLCRTLTQIRDMCGQQGITIKWPDLEFLEKHFEEDDLYGGQRPSKGDQSRYLHRILYSLGRGVDEVEISEDGKFVYIGCQKELAIRPPRNPQLYVTPVCTMSAKRLFNHSPFSGCAPEQAHLFLRAVTVQELLGESAKRVHFHAGEFTFKNMAELRKIARRDDPITDQQLMQLLRHRLSKELGFYGFDLHEFNKECLVLAAKLGHAWRSNNWNTDNLKQNLQYSAKEQLQSLAVDLSHVLSAAATQKDPIWQDGRRARLEVVRIIFDEWVVKKGDVGLKGISKKQRERKHVSSLKPSFLAKLGELHIKFGTPKELFTSVQREGVPWFKEVDDVETMAKRTFRKKRRV